MLTPNELVKYKLSTLANADNEHIEIAKVRILMHKLKIRHVFE